MKALILAAGLGTRLLPYTETTPKPLFTIGGRPLLDILIRTLQDAGCREIMINTHHLHEKIESFIADQKYTLPVYTRYEPVILGTGGAIKNVADFWDNEPFMVINSDIVTDYCLKDVYEFHLNHKHPVTLVLHNDPEFNTVSVDKDNFITDFFPSATHLTLNTSHLTLLTSHFSLLTFTGIQVLNPEILDFIPADVFSTSIDAYKKLMATGKKIKGFISPNSFWKDIGTPERYKEIAKEKMTEELRNKESGVRSQKSALKSQQMKGDGSDRKWYRITLSEDIQRSVIMADHGIKNQQGRCEAESFVRIGSHLYSKGIPVPEIYNYDIFSGLVFMEDLGNLHLQDIVKNTKNTDEIIFFYQSVIDSLIKMSLSGAEGFDTAWTYQSAFYDKELILERECRYFVDVFLIGYLKKSVSFEDMKDEFIFLADKALEFSVNGFMHRDMQSRNIMAFPNLKCGSDSPYNFYFIDFQSGRIGPLQYDLASLLIDPYVALPRSVQEQLLEYCIKNLSALIRLDPEKFRICYRYCSVTRNLQMLGAFGYLSKVKGKSFFEQYIPIALNSLRANLSAIDKDDLAEKLCE